MNIVLLLTALAAAPLLCTALDCSLVQASEAVEVAVQSINERQDHGYKFKLVETKSNKTEMVAGGCTLELQLDLGETLCPYIDQKPIEDCQHRGEESWAVTASCTVQMSIVGTEANVTKYSCSMRKDPAKPEDMVMICPDCPTLLNLNHEKGISAVKAGVAQFNQNITNQKLYVLQDVGRISSGYIMSKGMFYYSEFVVVETQCPMGSRIAPEACSPLCPDRANHAFCHLTYSQTDGASELECEFFPPKNTTLLGPGEQEITCPSPRSDVATCPGAETSGDPTVHPICPYSVASTQS